MSRFTLRELVHTGSAGRWSGCHAASPAVPGALVRRGRFRDTSELIEWAVDRLIAVRLTSRPKRKPKLRRGHVGITRRHITLVVNTYEADDVIGASVAYATVPGRWPIAVARGSAGTLHVSFVVPV